MSPRVANLLGPRPYLDTTPFILAVEEVGEFASRCREMLSASDRSLIHVITSELTLAEVLVAPIRNRLPVLAVLYRGVVETRPGRSVIPVTEAVLLRSASLRAFSHMKLPDAIHFATAIEAGCSSFVTNDRRSWPRDLLQVVMLQELE